MEPNLEKLPIANTSLKYERQTIQELKDGDEILENIGRLLGDIKLNRNRLSKEELRKLNDKLIELEKSITDLLRATNDLTKE